MFKWKAVQASVKSLKVGYLSASKNYYSTVFCKESLELFNLLNYNILGTLIQIATLYHISEKCVLLTSKVIQLNSSQNRENMKGG